MRINTRKFFRLGKFAVEYIPAFYIAIKKRVQYDSETWGWKVVYKKYV